jgi:hypothetical protein
MLDLRLRFKKSAILISVYEKSATFSQYNQDHRKNHINFLLLCFVLLIL